MQKVMRDKKAIVIFLFPAFILFVAIIVIPLFMTASYSLTEWDVVGDRSFVGFEQYSRLFEDDRFFGAVRNTLLFAFLSVVIQLPISLLLALILSGGIKKGSRAFLTIFFIPVVISSVVIGQLWRRMYHADHGLLNIFLRGIGFAELGTTPWLGLMETAFIAVVIPMLWQFIGYHMLLYYSGIRSISPDIYDAAKIDGAGFWRTTFSITLPLLKPIIQVSLTLAVVGSLRVYDLVRVLTDGGPSGASEVVATRMVRIMFYPNFNFGYGSAMAFMLIVVCFISYFLIGWLFRDRDELKINREERRLRKHG